MLFRLHWNIEYKVSYGNEGSGALNSCFAGDDISSESEINVDNPELEMLALESKVGHEIGASMSTINENNNEKNEQHCSNK